MRSRRRKIGYCLGLCGLLAWLVLDPVRVRGAVNAGLMLCARSVIPALFPFLVVSSLLISLGFGELISRPLEWLMQPLFRVSGAGASALILGLVGGYPMGPRSVAELYRDGLLSRPEARRLLTFCNNANPAFLINVLGVGIFGSVRVGLWLWLIHLGAALLTGLAFRFSFGRETPAAPSRRQASRTMRLSQAFVSAVGAGLQSILGICAFVVFFYVLSQPLSALPGLWSTLCTGALELFSAVPLLPAGRIGFFLAALLAGWGGLSVQCQTMVSLTGSGLPFDSCLLGKAVQAALSGMLALVLTPWVFPG